MVNMNLLNNLFDIDNTQLVKINKKYFKIIIFMLALIIILLCVEKNNYYTNTVTSMDGKIVLLADKDSINKIKKRNTITINDIETKYNINNISSENDIYLLDVTLNPNIKINNDV